MSERMPMEYRVVITPRASSDLEKIHSHIAQDSPQNADAFISRLLDALEPLKRFPRRMVLIDQQRGLHQPVRRLPVNPYVIYFRLTESKMLFEILHVRHGARRPIKRFTS